MPAIRQAIGLFLLLSPAAWGDLRYIVECEMKSTALASPGSGLQAQELVQDCNQQVFSKGKWELTRNSKKGSLLNRDDGSQIEIDYEAKTWQRISAEEQIEKMALEKENAIKSGLVPSVKAERIAEERQIRGMNARGIRAAYLMDLALGAEDSPKVTMAIDLELWTSMDVPGAAAQLKLEESFRAKGGRAHSQLEAMLATLPGMQDLASLQNLSDGLLVELRVLTRLLSQEDAKLGDGNLDPLGVIDAIKRGAPISDMVMRFTGFDTKPILASVFAIPAGFRELK